LPFEKDVIMLRCGMSRIVKLSDELVMHAREAASARERSVASQVEYWARIGKVVERVMTGQQVTDLLNKTHAAAMHERLDAVDTEEGRQRVKAYLSTEPYPHYFAHPNYPELVIREDAHGKWIAGRFVNRRFVAMERASR
jgi:hypothetical protein